MVWSITFLSHQVNIVKSSSCKIVRIDKGGGGYYEQRALRVHIKDHIAHLKSVVLYFVVSVQL